MTSWPSAGCCASGTMTPFGASGFPSGAVDRCAIAEMLKPIAIAVLVGCAILGLLALLVGCATTSTPTSQLDHLLSATKVAAYIGTAEATAVHPEWKPAFLAARDDLKMLESARKIDLAMLLAIVQRRPVKELRSDKAALIITSATILLADFDFGTVPLERTGQLKQVAKAIREGIELGLGIPTAWNLEPRTLNLEPRTGNFGVQSSRFDVRGSTVSVSVSLPFKVQSSKFKVQSSS